MWHAYSHCESGAACVAGDEGGAVMTMTRRELLKSGGALVLGFAWRPLRAQVAEGGATSEVDSFLAVHQDGSATIYTSHVDVGTGITTAYRQIAAEELAMPVERFTVVQGNTSEVPNHGGTGGSSGIPRGGADIRRAAATAHAALINLACAKLGKPASEIRIENGVVRATSGESVSVGELIGGKRFNVKVDKDAPLKDPKGYSTVGKPIPRP